MGFTNLREKTQGNAVAAKDLAVGQSIEGHLVRFITTTGKYGQSISPVLRGKDGEETVVWAAANIKFLKEDLAKAGLGPGVMLRITSVEPNPKSQYKSYFDFAFNEDDTIDVGRSEEDLDGEI